MKMTRHLAQILNYRVLDLIDLANIDKKEDKNVYFSVRDAIKEVIEINQT